MGRYFVQYMREIAVCQICQLCKMLTIAKCPIIGVMTWTREDSERGLHSYTKAIIDLVIAEQSMTQGQKLTNDGAILHLASKDRNL